MKKISCILISALVMVSLAACGGSKEKGNETSISTGNNADSNKTDSNNTENNNSEMIQEYIGSYTVANDYDDPAYAPTINEDSIEANGIHYAFNKDDVTKSEDGFCITTGELNGKSLFVELFMAGEGDAKYHSVSIATLVNGEYGDYIGEYILSSDAPTFELTTENWSDYLKIVKHVYVTNNSFDEPNYMYFEYALTPATDGVNVVAADIAVEYECAKNFEGVITYDIEKDTYEITDQKVKSSSDGKSDTKLKTRDFPYAGFVMGAMADYEYNADTKTVKGDMLYPGAVRITRLEGTVSLVGAVNIEDGKAAKEISDKWIEEYDKIIGAEEAADAEENLAKDEADYKDSDGYSVRAFEINCASGHYIAVHYDPAKLEIKYIDLINALNPATSTVESVKDIGLDVIGEFLNDSDATEAFGDNVEVSVYATSGIIIRFRIANLNDTKVIDLFNEYVAVKYSPYIYYLDDDLYSGDFLDMVSSLNKEFMASLFYTEDEIFEK